jgi:hypothetical protein
MTAGIVPVPTPNVNGPIRSLAVGRVSARVHRLAPLGAAWRTRIGRPEPSVHFQERQSHIERVAFDDAIGHSIVGLH